MNLRFVFFMSFLAGVAISSLAQDLNDYRHWTTSSGQRSDTRLKLVEIDDVKVQLQREDNGKMISILLVNLSGKDHDFLKANAKPANEEQATAGRSAAGWPQWRGVYRDGKSQDKGLLTSWPSGGPELLWNVTGLGEGYSAPAIINDNLYVLGAIGRDEFIFAMNSNSGKQLWKTRIGSKSEGGGYPGPRGTPTIDEDLIFTIGSDGSLVCIQRDSGSVVWSKNLKSDFAGQHGPWDYAESPLIDGNKLIVTPGGARSTIVALRKQDGVPIWSSAIGPVMNEGFARAGYASAIKATIGGTEQYVAFLHGGVVGVAAESGKALWHYDTPANETANCSTPIVYNDSVFAASAYGTGGGVARVINRRGTWNVNEVFFSNRLENHHGDFILHEGHLYGTNNTSLLCVDWNSGDIVWQDRCVGKGSVCLADGRLIVRSERGDVALVEATPDAYREQGRFTQPDRSDKNAWAHPVVTGGNLYLRDDDRMLCFKLR